MVTGIIGSVLPVLPGPVISYAGLILLQLSSSHPFSVTLMIVYAALTVLAALLDYLIPIYGTKRFEGTKYGIWGSSAGLVLGIIFFFPFGIIFGPVLGAFGGELVGGRSKGQAMKSAVGSFVGFLAGTALKLLLSSAMAYHFAATVYDLLSA